MIGILKPMGKGEVATYYYPNYYESDLVTQEQKQAGGSGYAYRMKNKNRSMMAGRKALGYSTWYDVRNLPKKNEMVESEIALFWMHMWVLEDGVERFDYMCQFYERFTYLFRTTNCVTEMNAMSRCDPDHIRYCVEHRKPLLAPGTELSVENPYEVPHKIKTVSSGRRIYVEQLR
jgi:hypothetical protein